MVTHNNNCPNKRWRPIYALVCVLLAGAVAILLVLSPWKINEQNQGPEVQDPPALIELVE